MFLLKNLKISKNQTSIFKLCINAFSTNNNQEYYKILGISSSSSPKEIKEAFYKLAKTCHPDVSKGSEDKFKEVNEAYKVLSDVSKKRSYDESLKYSQYPGYNSTSNSGSSANQNNQSSYNMKYGYGHQKERKPKNFSESYYHYNPYRQSGGIDSDSLFNKITNEFREDLKKDPEFRARIYEEYQRQQEVK